MSVQLTDSEKTLIETIEEFIADGIDRDEIAEMIWEQASDSYQCVQIVIKLIGDGKL